jgi:hypothetical protein
MNSNRNMAKSFITECSESSEDNLKEPTDTPLRSPTGIKPTPLSQHDIETDQDRRRKEVYKRYKHYAKPTKETMRRIAESTNDTDIVGQDIDLLPWNLEETALIKGAMKSLKKEKEKKDKKEAKKEKETKATERREDTAFELIIAAKSDHYNKRLTLKQVQMGNSSATLDMSQNGSSSSLDYSTDSWGQDDARHESENEEFEIDHQVSSDQLRTMIVEGRELRRRKIEEAKIRTLPETTRWTTEQQRRQQASKSLAVNERSNGTRAWLRRVVKSSSDRWHLKE